ncbi:MAG: NlpC/P60 family protein [Pseudomonadota bacterium]
MSAALDRRLHAYREDLADVRLSDQVEALEYREGTSATVDLPVADMRPAPNEASGIDTQLLHGDRVRVFDRDDDFVWCQSERDQYVGYITVDAIREEVKKPTHIVSVPRTFLYPEPDMKRPHCSALSMGSRLTIVGNEEVRGTRYAITNDGHALIQRHLRRFAAHAADYVTVAEQLLHTPYLWGGASAFGLDCSGLVQLAMMMCGKDVLRDSDMQAGSIGEDLGFAAMDGGLRRGDLVFWKGHVGIMCDADTLIHANGHTMSVARELLEDAVERIGYLYGFPTGLRRP